MSGVVYEDYLAELRKAPWPKCDELAAQIARLPGSADTLEAAALKARGHHARSAALKALLSIDRRRAEDVASKLIDDPSYEVRMDAAGILGPGRGAGRSTKKGKKRTTPRGN